MQHIKEMLDKWTKRKEAPGAVGIYFCQDSISMVHLDTDSAPIPTILAYQHVTCRSENEKKIALQSFVEKHALETMACHAIIELQDYKVTLLDAPPVSDNELIPSVRWMLKDVINYPLDEACVDIFHVPLARARDNAKLIYAVVTPLKVMIGIENIIKNSGLSLHSLGIPELALKNTLSFFKYVKHGSLLIYLHNNMGKLIIMDEKYIHMIRNIDLRDNPSETLILEIQRYLDYSNTLFRQNLCLSFLLTPNPLNDDIAPKLKSTLETETTQIDFSSFFSNGSDIPIAYQTPLLIALGAALSGNFNAQNQVTA
ncbi:MAG: hypothetical protein RLZ35_508 [Pseudomonadota bacterium]|jgi:MSHA biogenesis protein MshI